MSCTRHCMHNTCRVTRVHTYLTTEQSLVDLAGQQYLQYVVKPITVHVYTKSEGHLQVRARGGVWVVRGWGVEGAEVSGVTFVTMGEVWVDMREGVPL